MTDKPTILTRETLVPLGLVTSVIFACAGGVVWLNSVLTNLGHEVNSLGSEVRYLRDQVSQLNGQNWTVSDMRQWLQILEAKNPNLIVPKVLR